jgi:hypothetical protein
MEGRSLPMRPAFGVPPPRKRTALASPEAKRRRGVAAPRRVELVQSASRGRRRTATRTGHLRDGSSVCLRAALRRGGAVRRRPPSGRSHGPAPASWRSSRSATSAWRARPRRGVQAPHAVARFMGEGVAHAVGLGGCVRGGRVSRGNRTPRARRPPRPHRFDRGDGSPDRERETPDSAKDCAPPRTGTRANVKAHGA